jgi:hypothetical protein
MGSPYGGALYIPLLMCSTFKSRILTFIVFHWASETPTGTRDVGPGTAPLKQAYGGSSTNHQCEAGKLTRFIKNLPVHVKPCVKDVHEGPGGT